MGPSLQEEAGKLYYGHEQSFIIKLELYEILLYLLRNIKYIDVQRNNNVNQYEINKFHQYKNYLLFKYF